MFHLVECLQKHLWQLEGTELNTSQELEDKYSRNFLSCTLSYTATKGYVPQVKGVTKKQGTPKTNTMLYVNDISITQGGKRGN